MAERFLIVDTDMEMAYLYGHSSLIDDLGNGCSLVKVTAPEEAQASYLAAYQLGRIMSGLRARSSTVFPTEAEARAAALADWGPGGRFV